MAADAKIMVDGTDNSRYSGIQKMPSSNGAAGNPSETPLFSTRSPSENLQKCGRIFMRKWARVVGKKWTNWAKTPYFGPKTPMW
jgi:hypothetical protein